MTTSWNPFTWLMDKLVAHGEARARRAWAIESELDKIAASMSKLNVELKNCKTDAAIAECKLWIAGLHSLSKELQDELERL